MKAETTAGFDIGVDNVILYRSIVYFQKSRGPRRQLDHFLTIPKSIRATTAVELALTLPPDVTVQISSGTFGETY